MHKELSKEWLDWILENIQRGVDKKERVAEAAEIETSVNK